MRTETRTIRMAWLIALLSAFAGTVVVTTAGFVEFLAPSFVDSLTKYLAGSRSLAMALIVAGALLVVSIPFVAGLILASGLRRQRADFELPTTLPELAPSTEEEMLQAFRDRFQWLRHRIYVTLREIVSEKRLVRPAQRHHLHALLTVREDALGISGELFRLASSAGGDWQRYAEAFEAATERLSGAIGALSSVWSRPPTAMYQAAGHLYGVLVRLDRSTHRLHREFRGKRPSASPEHADNTDRQK